jgi:hypothetical protein
MSGAQNRQLDTVLKGNLEEATKLLTLFFKDSLGDRASTTRDNNVKTTGLPPTTQVAHYQVKLGDPTLKLTTVLVELCLTKDPPFSLTANSRRGELLSWAESLRKMDYPERTVSNSVVVMLIVQAANHGRLQCTVDVYNNLSHEFDPKPMIMFDYYGHLCAEIWKAAGVVRSAASNSDRTSLGWVN